MRYRRAGLAKVLACTAVLALAASACGSGGSGTSADGKVELTIATFNEFGYEDLLKEYEAANPNVKITQRKTGQAQPHHQNLFTKLAAGSGLADIEAVEEGYLSQVMSKSGQFEDLKELGPKDVKEDRWLQWKVDAVTTKDGKMIGYGTDIGPLAMCYRKDLFEAAKLPSDPESVKALFETWDSYFQAGDQYVQATGKAWFDSASQVFNPMHNQAKVGYFDRDDKLVIETNDDKKYFDQVSGAVQRGQSAKLVAWSDEWKRGFKESAFATKVCPSWMLGPIEENSGPELKGKWAVTAAFPGGGGNWGGSYLTVPKQGKNKAEAAKLAAWLTAPEQQTKAFVAKGTFPSQTQALISPELLNKTSEYFGGEKVGLLFSEQANKVPGAQYKGPQDGTIQETVISPALQAVEQGTSPGDAWNQVVEGAKKAAR
ncbi:ABC transporter substrate-binding protein [Saccharothrix syringae]|uniref:Carbohydrate ABC transporter substrate-binding protein n=1 Tax=Saccharothrix syringae TaxID=103733 RepID=A0A5Q0GVU9_SACSY|nr:ABC transporter substrate-binding protein [Saccharothrix syringae]QFZ18051.1 carbohydrate ABC transporter substrate-binding protein [Saccharothrix syringae]